MCPAQTAHVDTYARSGLPDSAQWPDLLFELPELRYPDRLNAGVALLDEMCGEFGDRPCIYASSGTWTYSELSARSNQIARVLVDEMSLVPGNRVLLRAPNTPETIACWFAVLKAGGIAVSTLPLLRSAELAKVIERGQITHALCDVNLGDELDAARQVCPMLLHALSYGPGGELDQLRVGKSTQFDPVATASDDIALIAFTSGTTGDPKGCVHFHRDLLAVCDTYARHVLHPSPDDVFTGTPPIAFTFGLGGLVLFPLRFGASTVPIAQPGAETLLNAITTYDITTLFTAPTAYRAMLRNPALPELGSLRTCVAAGEPLSRATSDAWFERVGIRILDGIGSTEMLHIFISTSPQRVRPGATGVPVPGYQARVVDNAMQPLPAGQTGRLAVRGPVGCRYLYDERQADYVVDGWNITGDTFTVDEDGYFWFQARADDMIVSSGYNISALEVESALLEHYAVRECAVVAAPDEDRGHVVMAFVVLADGFTSSESRVSDLQLHVKAQIAPYKYPRRIEFVDDLPRTATGKIQRFRLRPRADEAPPPRS